MQLTNNLANSKYLKKKLHVNTYNKFENVIKILYSNITNFDKNKFQIRQTKLDNIQKSKYGSQKRLLILFSIDNSTANISFYALSRPKLNFGYYLTFELTF
jgi:hypothetical protein